MALPVLLTNQPAAGSISWSAFGIQYDGLSYDIPANYTDKKFTWWDYDAAFPTVARTNFVNNPRLASGTTGWGGSSGTATRVAVSEPWLNALGIDYAYQRTGSSVPSGARSYCSCQTLTVGQTYTAFFFVKVTSSVAGASWIARITTTSDGTTGTVLMNPVATIGEWVMVAAVFTAASATMYPMIRRAGTAGTSGDTETWLMTGVMVTEGDVLSSFPEASNFFDGAGPSSNVDSTSWTGTVNNSNSLLVQAVGQRNYSEDPGCVNAGVSNGGPGSWAGTGGAYTVVRGVTAPWSRSGKAYQVEWTTSPSTQGVLQLSSMKNVIHYPGLWTASLTFKVVAGSLSGPPSSSLGGTEFGASNAGIVASDLIDLGDDTYRVWTTWNVQDINQFKAQSNPRVDYSISSPAVGLTVQMSEIDIYRGAYDPERDWFWGSGGVTGGGYKSVWLGSENASPSFKGLVVPGTFSADTLPELAPEDCLLFLNKNGVGVLVPTTQVIEGSLIVSGSVLADAIAANQIDAWHLRANAVTVDALAANAVTSPAIAAGAITTEKLSVASVSDSLLANGSFEDLTQGWSVIQSGTGFNADVVTGVASSGANALRLQRGAQAGEDYDLIVAQQADYMVGVSPSALRRWYVACRAGASATLTDGFYLRVYWYMADRATPSAIAPVSDIADNVALSTTWELFEGQVTPPDDARYARVAFINAKSGSTMYVDEAVMHQVTVSAMIGDGAIQAIHVAANSITADAIAANAVGADAIASNSIMANHLVAGSIQTNHLSPAVGQEIDISANQSVNLIAADVAQVINDLGEVTGEVAVIATVLSVLPEAVEITQANTDYKLSLTANAVSISKGTSVKSVWNESGLIADQFKGRSVIVGTDVNGLGGHQMLPGPNGSTVVKGL